MAKYYGNIGFAETQESAPSVYTEVIKELPYYGDVIRNYRRLQPNSNQLNDDIAVSNEISILADPYANQNFFNIRYAEFNGAKWKVTSVEVQFPRLLLSLGGVYNGAD